MATDLLESRLGKTACGYCHTGHHERCSRTIRNGKVNGNDRLHTCPCDHPGCPSQELRCMDCRNTNAEEINPYTMLCEDRTACTDTVQQRRINNPLLQQIREIKERTTMAENTKKAERKAATPKVGKCLVTGKPTKGGNFLPGMDARYVSLLVQDVTEGKSTEKQAKDKIKADLGDKSANLTAKFEKSIAIAKEKAEKKKAAEKEKAAAKKAASAKKK